MDKETKELHEGLAKYAEDRADEMIERALKNGVHGPQAVLAELIQAGGLLTVAKELRSRAK